MARKADGRFFIWGTNQYGQIGNGTTTSVLSPIPFPDTTSSRWTYAHLGAYQTYAMKEDSTLWAWGDNQYGQFGNGTTTTSTLATRPVRVQTNVRWRQIYATVHVRAIDDDGSMWTWGFNSLGQVGNGSTTNVLSPIPSTIPTACTTLVATPVVISQAGCAGSANGSASVTASGGLPPFTYSWAPSGGTGATATGLSAGTYTVTVRDALGLVTTASVTITENGGSSASISYPGSPFCATGTAMPTLTGTTGGTYSSSAGLSINASSGVVDLAASAPGTYTVTYNTAASGGCSSAPATATLTINAPAIVDAPANITTCAGGTVSAAAFTGSAVSYVWTNSNPSIGLAASGTGNLPTFTALNPGSSAQTATITVTPRNSGIAYVPNSIDNNVMVVHTESNSVVGNIPVGLGPIGVAVSPDGSRVYVTNYTSNDVSVINTATNSVVATIAVGSNPFGVVVSPDGSQVYVVNQNSNSVSVINTSTNTVTNTVVVGMAPMGIAVSPDGSRIYVTNFDSQSISVINTATNAVVANIAVGLNPLGIAVAPDGGRVYVANLNAGTVSVIDATTNSVVATIGGMTQAFGVAVAPDGSRIYVSDPTSNNIGVVNTATNSVVASVAVGSGPSGVSVSQDGSRVYAANQQSNDLSVINTASNTLLATIGLGGAPHALGNFLTAASCAGTPQTFTISVNPAPAATFNYAGTPYCSGPGTATPTLTGTTGGTYSSTAGLVINATSGVIDLAASTPGTYTVTYAIAASGGCAAFSTTATVTITAPATATISASGPLTFCSGGSVTLSVPAGATSYLWSNGATGNSITVSTAGNYSVAVTSGACVANGGPVTVVVNPTPTVNAVTSQTLCNGAATTAVTFSGAVTGTTYAWTNSNAAIGLGASGTGNIPSFTATNSTNAPISGTITVTPSANNCTGTAQTFTITVNPTPTVDAITSQTLCNGAATTAVTFSGAVTGTTFAWTNSNAAIGLGASGNGTIPSFTATNTTNAPITGTITVTPSANNCTGTAQTFTYTVNPTPTVNTITSQTLCNGAASTAVTLAGPVAGSSFAWTNSNPAIGLGASGTGNIPSFTATNTTNAPISGTITVTPSANNCTGTAQTFTYTVNPTPTVDAITSQTLCNGAATTAVTFSGAVTGTTYAWTNSNPAIGLGASGTGNIASFTATNTTNAPITGTITVTPSANNCTGTAQTFTYTVNPTPTVNAVTNQTLCNGAATAAVTLAGPVAGSTFAWTNSNPAIGLGASGTGDIASFTATNTTNAPISGTITVTPSANNCTGTAQTFTITVNPTPTANAVANQTLCAEGITQAVALAGPVAGTTFAWTNNTPSIGLAASGTGNLPAFVAVNSTAAPVTATVSVTPSANNCTGTPITFTYTVNPLPTGTITTPQGTLVCQGFTTPLQVSGGVSYQWFLNGTAIPNATAATFNASQAGTYSVNITNSFGCTRAATNTVTLTLVQRPTAGFTFSTFCQNLPVQFTNTTNTTGAGTVTYQWSFGNGATSTQTSPTATYTTVGTYQVRLIASPNGCVALNDTVTQSISIVAPIAGRRLEPQNIRSGEATRIEARNFPNARYGWSPATGLSNPGIWYPLATLSQEQEYRITAVFPSGCVTIDTLLVRIFRQDDIFVPTAFSPNGDGVNDVLRPIMVGINSFRSFRIFDRLGRELFVSNSVNVGWDGTYRGQQLPAETYMWVAEGWDNAGKLIRKSGQVVLVR